MKIASLDGLRGVAAILVVLFHENYWFSQTGLVPKAYLAVDFFFCLSGFIIAYSYSEHLISGQLSFLKFSAIRLVRLYPLYLLGTVLGLLRLSVQIAIGHPAAPSISNFLVCVVTALLFLPSTSPRSELYPANSLAWSLGFELAVNLAYAAVLPYLTPRRSAIITSACCLTFTALVFVKGSAEMGPFWIDFAGATFRTLASFSIGVTVFNFRNRIMMRAPPIILMIVLAMFLAAPVVGGPFFDLAFCFAVSPALVAVAANSTGLKWKTRCSCSWGLFRTRSTCYTYRL